MIRVAKIFDSELVTLERVDHPPGVTHVDPTRGIEMSRLQLKPGAGGVRLRFLAILGARRGRHRRYSD